LRFGTENPKARQPKRKANPRKTLKAEALSYPAHKNKKPAGDAAYAGEQIRK
jgi:hypothetical protein